MKVKFLVALLLIAIFGNSCITKDSYKETDIFEDYETEAGFGVFHIPPVLFRIVFSLADDEESDQLVSKDILDKVDLIKVLFFQPKENTKSINDVRASMNDKIKSLNYNLLTRIAQEKNDISIYIINQDDIIREVLIKIVSDTDFICLNVIGELSQDEVMQVYKSVNMNEIQNISF
jgi:hypothetical protein